MTRRHLGLREGDDLNRSDTVIVPLDGSTHALVALPVARTLSRTLGATLHVVHVGVRKLPPQDLLSHLHLTDADLAGTVVSQRAGSPAAAILGVASERNALLIVLCTRTGAPAAPCGMGPVADEILHDAACPTVLVRPERGIGPFSLGRILLPHDGTPTSAAAIEPGARLATLAGAELTVLHVAEPGAPQPGEPGTLTVPRYVDQPQHEWPAWGTEFLERLVCLGCLPADLKVKLELARGRPGEEIVQRAGDRAADLILLAWRGRFDRDRAPIVRDVIRRAPCPVLVLRAVPGAEPAWGLQEAGAKR